MSNEKPNFYMMPGDPMKKLDTPGGFSYKAESTMNKLGMGDAMANSGHESAPPLDHKVDGKEHTSEVDGHSHGGVVNTVKNFARNYVNPKIKYGSSAQQGGMAQRKPDHSFRPFGKTDEELEKEKKS